MTSSSFAYLQRNPDRLHQLNPSRWTPEIADLALSIDLENWQYLRSDLLTEDRLINIVKVNPTMFPKFPVNLQTYRLVEIAVILFKKNFSSVRKDLIDKPLALLAVDGYPDNFLHVDKSFQTIEMVEEVISARPDLFPLVRHDLQTIEMVRFAVEANPDNLRFARQDLMTPSTTRNAVLRDINLTQHVPEDHRTPEMESDRLLTQLANALEASRNSFGGIDRLRFSEALRDLL